jgi:Effector protein
MDSPETKPTLNPKQMAFVQKWLLDGGSDARKTDEVAPSQKSGAPESELASETELAASANMHDKGRSGNVALDLGPVPRKLKATLADPNGGMIAEKDWGIIAAAQNMARTAFTLDFAGSITAAKAQPNKMARIQAVLPLLDAPENNPERKDVGVMLAELEEIDKRYADLDSGPLTDEAKTQLAKERAQERVEKLNEMERKLGEWLNRRTEQGLPPTQEAMAMNDLVQREHTKVIKEFVDKGWSPPPVADANEMTDEEVIALKKTWDDLVNGTSCIQVEVKDPGGTENDKGIYDHLKGLYGPVTPEQVEAFKGELLSNMSRLLGTPAGRDLIANLDKAGKKINFYPGNNPQAWAFSGETKVLSGTDVDQPESAKKAGDHTTIEYPLGRKDSDEILRTEDGNFLFSPTHVIIGHEMVHALHNSEGTHRGDITGMTPEERAMWTDFEEVWTINKGKLSEQTLRNDYGLSADRFGHAFPETKDELADKAIAQAEKAEKFYELMHSADTSKPKVDVEKILVEDRKFGKAFYDRLTDAMKYDVYADKDCVGPLPVGWDPLRLTVGKIKSIVADKLPCRMPMLGWTSYNLEYSKSTEMVFGFPKSIMEIVSHRVHHPRTAQGRQFRDLGEAAVFARFDDFKRATGTDLGSWNDRDWRVNLRTMIRAAATADQMISSVPFLTVVDASMPDAPDAKDPLETKLKRISDRFVSELVGQEPEKAGPYFTDNALVYFSINNLRVTEQVTELKKKEAELKQSDSRLKTLGKLEIGAMSLVARAKAAEALNAFEKDPLAEQAKELAKQVDALIGDEDEQKAAAKVYAELLGKIDLLTAKLSAISPASVADAIRQIVMAPLDQDLIDRADFGDILDAAMEASESKGKTLAAENPDIEQILSNNHLCDSLGAYIEKTADGGATLWSFRFALHMRETRTIADLAQGKDLVVAGLKQNTVVCLRRDATDSDARAAATSEVRSILSAHVVGFLKWFGEQENVA